ncbi:glutamine amidotransferase%2C class-II [Mycobacterium tuberculosis]|nr:glutamine amidotransferase%2C class-II [Mycobacterium tuberculosis]
MCRLFGLHSGTDAVTATFWLLNASDSLAEQSRRNPDGTGLGVFDEHPQPRLHKQPIAAWQDADFATEAHELTGTTFVAHVRYATTGSLDIRNTHPFLQDGRIFAHNGVVEGLDVLDERLREVGADDLVLGQTDSERVFALITASIRARDGNESAGLIDALRWLAANVPIYAVNVLLSTATDVWALRYPESHELYILDRRGDGAPEFHLRSKRIRAHSTHLRERSSVVFATEPMDDNPRWRLLDAGELVHVDAALRVNRSLVLPDPPRHPIRREDLRSRYCMRNTRRRELVTTRRALVLAGGGLAGIAWETGVLRGIADESPAAARLLLDSDVLVGTSAGATVAAQISSGCPLDTLYERQLAETSAEIDPGVDIDAITDLFLTAVTEPHISTRRRLQRIGAVALAVDTVPESVRRQVIAQRLPSHDWPDRVLRVTAIDIATGELVVFHRESNVALVDAVAASCSVPGAWPPVTIAGRRYMDGGVASSVNLGVADDCDAAVVLVPAGADAPSPFGGGAAAEIAAATGMVFAVFADDDSLAAFGPNPLDPLCRVNSAMAGRQQGRREAQAVARLLGV